MENLMKIFGVNIPTEMLTFFAGICVSSIVFLFKWLYVTLKYLDFQFMLKQEYVEPETIGGRTPDNIKEEYEKSAAKVDYLIKNELSNLSYLNQFKFLRLAEFTKIYFENCIDIMNQYPFKDLNSEGFKIELLEISAIEKILPKLMHLYGERKSDHVSMKRDSFLSAEEILQFKTAHMTLVHPDK